MSQKGKPKSSPPGNCHKFWQPRWKRECSRKLPTQKMCPLCLKFSHWKNYSGTQKVPRPKPTHTMALKSRGPVPQLAPARNTIIEATEAMVTHKVAERYINFLLDTEPPSICQLPVGLSLFLQQHYTRSRWKIPSKILYTTFKLHMGSNYLLFLSPSF